MAWADIVARREPRPGLLGIELEPFPYLSAYSVLLRVSRITALEPKEWFQRLGLRYSCKTIDLSALKVGRLSRRRFEEATGLAKTQVPVWWSEEAWSPTSTNGVLDRLHRPVRGCVMCAQFGYHTMLFQLPSIARCPWHSVVLTDSCPHCKRSPFTDIDQQGRLGRCGCDLDRFSIDQATVDMYSFPTAKAEHWLSRYLTWANKQRTQRHVVASDGSDRWLAGYESLAAPPQALSLSSGLPYLGRTRLEQVKPRAEVDPPAADFWGWNALCDQSPLTFVPLPAGTLEELTKVTRRVIAGFPRGTRTPIQLASFNDFDERATLGENAARRPECFIAPHARSADGLGWLSLSAVDIGTLQLCGQLIDRVVQVCDPEPVEGDFSRQSARTQALDRISGRRHLAGALHPDAGVLPRTGCVAALFTGHAGPERMVVAGRRACRRAWQLGGHPHLLGAGAGAPTARSLGPALRTHAATAEKQAAKPGNQGAVEAKDGRPKEASALAGARLGRFGGWRADFGTVCWRRRRLGGGCWRFVEPGAICWRENRPRSYPEAPGIGLFFKQLASGRFVVVKQLSPAALIQ